MESNCIDHGFKGDAQGYCRTTTKTHRNTRKHRVVFAEANGVTLASLDGKVVRHKCDNPRCINPDHLEIGTQLQNVADRVSRNRCAKKLTQEQVDFIRMNYKFRDKEYGQTALARRFGVTKEAVYSVVHGRNWR